MNARGTAKARPPTSMMPRMMARAPGTLATVLLALSVAAADISIHVAPSGSDRWSGGPAEANAAGTDGPLQTLQAARDRARQLRAADATEPLNIVLRGGTYYLPETLLLTLEDSGSAEAPITWRSYENETVLISGGRLIEGLQETRQGEQRIWQANLPEVKSGEWYFRQLFARKHGEDGLTRRFRPHKGMLATAGLTYSQQRKSMAHRAAQQDFLFFPGDLEQWQNLSDVEVVALHSWSASRLKIHALDLEQHAVTLTSVPTFRIGHWYKDERNPYYVENVREALAQPGEWYLDRPSGVFTYLPVPGETVENTTLVAPRLEKLIILQGDPESGPFVEHVRFEGLRFGQNHWLVPEDGYDTSQGQPQLPAAIELTGARFCGLQKCVIANTGAYGVSLGLGCERCSVRGCFLYDLGGGGVKVGDYRMNQQAQPPILPVGNSVENNTITHYGVVHYSANGVWAGIVRDTTIRHNEVAHGPYTGIAVGWNWSPTPTSAGGNIIERNHVHHVMDLVQDGGGIYTLGRQPGNIIRGNLIHDNHAGRFACNTGQCGLYFDQGSSGFLVEDNIVYDVEWNDSQIVQNQNTLSEHDIRTNYLGTMPGEPGFPADIAAQAGVEEQWAGIVFPVTVTPNPVYAMQWPELPPVARSLNMSFEDVPVGMTPRRWNKSATAEGADIVVTDQVAAAGERSLRFTDKPDMARPFYPYLYYHTNVTGGSVVLEFDFRQGEPGGIACIEFRDYQDKAPGSFSSGPSFVISPDGILTVGGKSVAQLPPGQWTHLKVTFSLGEGAAKEYELTVTPAGGEPSTATLAFARPDFAVMTDLYVVSNGTEVASFYLDNLKLTVDE